MAPHVVVEDVTVEAIRDDARASTSEASCARDGPPPRRPRRRLLGLVRRLAGPRLPRLEPRGRRARVAAPTLLIQGADDPYGTSTSSTASRRACAGRSSGSWSPAGTRPHLEQPEAVVEAIAEFAARLR